MPIENPVTPIRVAWGDPMGTRRSPAKEFWGHLPPRPRNGPFKLGTPFQGPKRPFFQSCFICPKNAGWPKFLASFGRPPWVFPKFEKKIWNFFKILDFGPENAKMWPLFKSKNGRVLIGLRARTGAHRKALELGFHPESTASGATPSQPSYGTFKVWVKFAPFPFGETEKIFFFENSFSCKIQF